MQAPTLPSRLIAAKAACVLSLALGALPAASAQEAPAPSAQPAAVRDTARLRLFGQNGVLVESYCNSSCIGGPGEKTTVSGD